MEVDFGSDKEFLLSEPEFCLVDVGGGAGIVNWDAVRRDEAGELEELVEVALAQKWHYDYHHLSFFESAWVVVRILIMDNRGVYLPVESPVKN